MTDAIEEVAVMIPAQEVFDAIEDEYKRCGFDELGDASALHLIRLRMLLEERLGA